jgi:hypothetical protein
LQETGGECRAAAFAQEALKGTHGAYDFSLRLDNLAQTSTPHMVTGTVVQQQGGTLGSMTVGGGLVAGTDVTQLGIIENGGANIVNGYCAVHGHT